MPEHEGTNMHNGSGTPPTAHERHMQAVALDRVRHYAAQVDEAIAHRDRAIQEARTAGADEYAVEQAAGVL